MSVFKGKKLYIEIKGESHSKQIITTCKGFPKTTIDSEYIAEFLERRKPNFAGSTTRVEKDTPTFKGIKGNKIKGKFSFVMENNNVNKKDYTNLYGIIRPSHADLGAYYKDGTLDFSGGGRFSGRLTAPLCVVGAIATKYLESLGIKICAFVSMVGNVAGSSYKKNNLSYEDIIEKRKGKYPSLDNKENMILEIEKAKENGDSVGGKIECIVYGMKRGIGDNLFNGLENKISSLAFAIPAVKGVEFGLGFDFAHQNGSTANDSLKYEDGNIVLTSNNNGGINGGISNGEPITIGVAFKPTPTISIEQDTVDLVKKENVKIKVGGRHDACIVSRTAPCVESVVAIAILDELLG